MIPVDKAAIVRVEKGKEKFEILADPDKVLEMKAGKEYDLDDVLAVDRIYHDIGQATAASDEDLMNAFGTTDFEEVALKMIKEGEIRLTTEQRRRMQEEKKRQIIEYISRNAVDPRTHAPHTPKRIELAMEEAGVHVDPLRRVSDQVEAVLEKIRKIIPIKMETVQIMARIPGQHATRIYGVLKKYKIIKENWQSDGSLSVVVELPGGLQSEFYDTLNKLTHGEAETTILERR